MEKKSHSKKHQNKNSKDIENNETEFLIKFPRTRHLLNIGGVGRDDLVMEATEVLQFLQLSGTLTIEEKVDGANLGISMTEDFQLTFQVDFCLT